MAEHLELKWGTLKGWSIETEKSRAALEKCFVGGRSMSAAMQRDTPEQREALLELIDAIDGPIWNDWDGVKMSKDEAKKYVTNYGKETNV